MPDDKFGPVTSDECLQIPDSCQVFFIDSDEGVSEKLSQLIGKPLIGLDQEWKPTMTKFDRERPGVLQLSDDKVAYLVDMVKLASSKVLDDVLTQIF